MPYMGHHGFVGHCRIGDYMSMRASCGRQVRGWGKGAEPCDGDIRSGVPTNVLNVLVIFKVIYYSNHNCY